MSQEYVHLKFSEGEQVAQQLTNEMEQLCTIAARIKQTSASLLDGNLQGAFMDELQARLEAIDKQFQYICTEMGQPGEELMTVVRWFRELMAELIRLFENIFDKKGGGGGGDGKSGGGGGDGQKVINDSSAWLSNHVKGSGWDLVNTEGFDENELLVQVGGSCTIYGIMNLLVSEGVDISQAEANQILAQMTEQFGRDSSFPFSAAQEILEDYGVDFTSGDFNTGGKVDSGAAESFLIENLESGNPVYVWTEVDDSFGLGSGGHAYTVLGAQTDANGNLTNVLVSTNWGGSSDIQVISGDDFMDDWTNFNNQAFYVTIP